MSLTDKITGKLKKAAGDIADDASLRRQGAKEQRKGEAKDELARSEERADRKAEEVRWVIHEAKQVVTDSTGAFTLDELIPEQKFFFYSRRRGGSLLEEGSKPRYPLVHMVKPGECRDLVGGVVLRCL